MNTSLFEVSKDYSQALVALYDMEQDGVIDAETFLDTMEGLEGEVTEKIKRVAAYIRNTKAQADSIKNAMAEMAKRSKSLDNHAAGLTKYLLENMTQNGFTAVNGVYFDVKVKKTPAAVIIESGLDVETLNESYRTTKVVTTTTANKAELKKAIQGGEVIKGISLVSGHRLEIK